MQNNRVWERGCGLLRTVVEGVRFDEAGDAYAASLSSTRPFVVAAGTRVARARGGAQLGARSLTKPFIQEELLSAVHDLPEQS